MVRTLPALLGFLCYDAAVAVRPQSGGAAEVLTVGYRAAMQRHTDLVRPQQSPRASASSAVTETPTISSTTTTAAAATTASIHTVRHTWSNTPGPIIEGRSLSPTLSDFSLNDVKPERGPVAELAGDEQEAATRHDSEAAQELDDIITDVEETERVLWKLAHKLIDFYSIEGYRHIFLNLVVYLAAVFIALGLYFMWFQHREVSSGQEFRYGLCDCMGDSRVCICGFCCPAIRWADTVSEEKAGFLVFSYGFLLMLCLGMMSIYPVTGVLGWLGVVCIGVYYRQKIREKYGLDYSSVSSYVEDFCIWSWCGCLALCQEARQVDEYQKMAEEFTEESQTDDGSRFDEGESY